MAKLAVFGCLEKDLFTLFCFELRKYKKVSKITLCVCVVDDAEKFRCFKVNLRDFQANADNQLIFLVAL